MKDNILKKYNLDIKQLTLSNDEVKNIIKNKTLFNNYKKMVDKQIKLSRDQARQLKYNINE